MKNNNRLNYESIQFPTLSTDWIKINLTHSSNTSLKFPRKYTIDHIDH